MCRLLRQRPTGQLQERDSFEDTTDVESGGWTAGKARTSMYAFGVNLAGNKFLSDSVARGDDRGEANMVFLGNAEVLCKKDPMKNWKHSVYSGGPLIMI